MAQRELAFQKHIIDSYKNAGGHARKWASEWQAGPPDLICALPGVGVHLIEVKHLPTFGENVVKNPMTSQQVNEAKRYIDAGGLAFLGVVSGTKAIYARLWLFDPLVEKIDPKQSISCKYVPGEKFQVIELLNKGGYVHV